MKLKQIAWLLICCMLLGVFAACGNQTAEASTVQSANESAVAAEEASAEEIQAPVEMDTAADGTASEEEASVEEISAEEATPELTPRVSYDLPLFDAPQSFRYFCVYSGMSDSKYDFNYWNELADVTNVNVEYVEVSEFAAKEQYSLMLASNDMCEVVWEGGIDRTATASLYPGGYDVAIDEEIYVDLSDYIAESCPNYTNLLEQYPDVKREITTSSGAVFCFSQIFDNTYTINMGPFVRSDVMEAAGINEYPTTIEGWLDSFAAMKDTGICEVLVRADNSGALNCSFGYAFGTTAGSNFLLDNASGKVFYDATSDNFRNYLEFFRECYTAGYLDQDFITSDQTMADVDSGRLCMFDTMATAALNQMGGSHPLAAIAPPVLEAEGKPLLAAYASHATTFNWCCVTTAALEHNNMDIILKWFDYLYSDEGIQAANYGFHEGESYEVKDDGVLQLLPEMLNRNGNNFTGVMIYTMKEGPSLFHWDLEYRIQTDEWRDIADTWISVDTSDTKFSTLPSLSLNAGESGDITTALGDIETYASAQILSWMTCNEALTDESWDAYVANIDDMGLDDVLEMYQAAYDDYMNR